MKLATLAAIAGSAAAFAPTQQGRVSTSVKGFENELGVIAPTGFFDPLGFTNDIDQEKFDQYRTAELKRKCVTGLKPVQELVPVTHLLILMVILRRTCCSACRRRIYCSRVLPLGIRHCPRNCLR